MGLLQKAVETYDAMAHRAGVVFEKEKEPLAPVSHSLARAQIEITLNREGEFVSARTVGKDEPKIIIPVTEASAGRANMAAELPHPLCDYLRYMMPGNPVEYNCYVKQLSDWASTENLPKLNAILEYVKKGTILEDLTGTETIRLGPNGRPDDEKLLVRWIVNGLGEESNGPCWTDKALMQSFTRYYGEKKRDAGLCMISGQTEPLAVQHVKGIVAKYGNAKLISSNDKSGFTFRGRIQNASQAATVGYVASQKAHNALRWLVSNQGVSFGKRTFLCWNPRGIPLPGLTSFLRRKGSSGQRAVTPSQYQKQLREALFGWKENLPRTEGVVIAAFDAATTGRLAVTYYNELLASDFLQRLHDWETTCCWENYQFGIQSPSLYHIIACAYGTLRNGEVEVDDGILGQQMQRLAACRVDKGKFPRDMEQTLVEKASNLQIYTGGSQEETKKLRENLVFTTCAVIRKYHYDNMKEEWSMSLDKNNTDRSYLFGRLLAIAETVENSTYDDETRRETNAMRMQRAFSLRPMATWRLLEERLEPYYRQLNPGLRSYYRKMTQEITDKISASDRDLNQKLEDVYLLGYYHQRAFRTEKTNEEKTEE